jgi:hypothetical protein
VAHRYTFPRYGKYVDETIVYVRPFCFAGITASVLEYKARAHKKELPNDSTAKGIYLVTWVLIFCMAVVITVVWYKINISNKEFKIRGRLAGLQGDEQLRSRFKLLFIRREYENSATIDYDWIILSNRPLSTGSEVLFIIDRSLPPNHEDLETYKVPILVSFYDSESEIELTYDRVKKTISFETGQGSQIIKTLVTLSQMLRAHRALEGAVVEVVAVGAEKMGNSGRN